MNSSKNTWVNLLTKYKKSANDSKKYEKQPKSDSTVNGKQRRHTVIVTPSSIPAFIIPGESEEQQPAIREEIRRTASNPGKASSPVSGRTSPCFGLTSGRSLTNIAADDGYTSPKADPWSHGGMSLTHLPQVKTPYGFSTLAEAPHTRRKESLFHDASAPGSHFSLLNSPNQQRISEGMKSRNEARDKQCRRGSPVSATFTDSEGTSSSSASPAVSPIRQRAMSTINRQAPSRRSSTAERRKSANTLRAPKNVVRRSGIHERRWSEDTEDVSSASECSSLEPSPVLERRERREAVMADASPRNRRKCRARDRGGLKFAISYSLSFKEIRVKVIKGENLVPPSHSTHFVHSFVKLYLMPGKQQRKQTKIVKHTGTPKFEEDFVFENISNTELQNMMLRMKVFNKESSIKRSEFLGEVPVLLNELNLQNEVRMWKDIQPKIDKEDLGMLRVSVSYDRDSGLFKLGVLRASDLPRHIITGAPATYVKVDIMDSAGRSFKHQTRTCRKNSNPVFNEPCLIHIGQISMGELAQLSVVLNVYDREHLMTDAVIGQVRLGCHLGTEESELYQWRKFLEDPENEITEWHNLMEPDDFHQI